MERRLTGSDGGPGRVVVGVDGSECSKDALRWAPRQAELTGAALDVIAASQFPAFYGWTSAELVGPDFARFAGQALTDTVDEAFGADVPAWLRSRVVEGHAGQVLVEASAGAELLVVATAATGGFTVCSSARSAPTVFITRTARSPSSGLSVTARSHRHQALQKLTTWAVPPPSWAHLGMSLCKHPGHLRCHTGGQLWSRRLCPLDCRMVRGIPRFPAEAERGFRWLRRSAGAWWGLGGDGIS